MHLHELCKICSKGEKRERLREEGREEEREEGGGEGEGEGKGEGERPKLIFQAGKYLQNLLCQS